VFIGQGTFIPNQKKLLKFLLIILARNIVWTKLLQIYNCCDLGLTATSGEGWELIPCKSTPDYAELELFFRNIPRIGRIETGRHIQILLDHLSDEFGQILSSLYSSYYSNR